MEFIVLAIIELVIEYIDRILSFFKQKILSFKIKMLSDSDTIKVLFVGEDRYREREYRKSEILKRDVNGRAVYKIREKKPLSLPEIGFHVQPTDGLPSSELTILKIKKVKLDK